jgi:hypothetical protein
VLVWPNRKWSKISGLLPNLGRSNL